MSYLIFLEILHDTSISCVTLLWSLLARVKQPLSRTGPGSLVKVSIENRGHRCLSDYASSGAGVELTAHKEACIYFISCFV